MILLLHTTLKAYAKYYFICTLFVSFHVTFKVSLKIWRGREFLSNLTGLVRMGPSLQGLFTPDLYNANRSLRCPCIWGSAQSLYSSEN